MKRRNTLLIPMIRSQFLRRKHILHGANLANPSQLHNILTQRDRALGRIALDGLHLDIVRGRRGLAVHRRGARVGARGTAALCIGRRRGSHVRGVDVLCCVYRRGEKGRTNGRPPPDTNTGFGRRERRCGRVRELVKSCCSLVVHCGLSSSPVALFVKLVVDR